MAKKKVTHQSKDHHNQPKQQESAAQNPPNSVTDSTTNAVAMDDSSEKLQSLKSLNARLLKETFEGRQQIDSLVQAKESLRAELTRSGLEKKVLETELNRASEESLGLELEKGVFGVFVEAQMGQMMRERVERARSEKESEIGSLKREVSELLGGLENEKEKLREMEERERLLKEEVEKLRVQYKGMVKEKEERERVVEGLKKEKVLAGRNLAEFERSVGKLKSENEKIAGDKNEVERIKSGLEVKIGVLEKEVGQKNEIVSGLRGEVEALRGKISELEKSFGKGKKETERKLAESERLVEKFKSEKEKILSEKNEAEGIKSELEDQIGVLEKEVEQKNETVSDLRGEVEVMREKILEMEGFIGEGMKEMELEVKSLMEEKDEKEKNMEKLHLQLYSQLYEVEAALKMSVVEANNKELRIEELIRKKNEIEGEKVHQKNEIVALHNEVGELRDTLFALRNSCRDYEENNKQLLSELGNCKDALDRVTLEKNEAQKAFTKERKNVDNLKLVISEREKSIQEIADELRALRGEQENLLDNAKATESRLESLVKERDSAQKSLLEAQSRVEEWRAKVKSAGVNHERALIMLKKTASMILSPQSEHGKREVVNNEQKLEEEVRPYAAELEAIQNAFRNKDKMVEDMKEQVESLKRSEAEAHKRKSFWTLVSSVTTIFAAASVAYVAKGR